LKANEAYSTVKMALEKIVFVNSLSANQRYNLKESDEYKKAVILLINIGEVSEEIVKLCDEIVPKILERSKNEQKQTD
jgi:hypothetical protein